MLTKKICWVQHASEFPLFNALANELKERGYRSLFVCKTKTAYAEYNKVGHQAFLITTDCFTDSPITEEQKTHIENTYGKGILRKVAESDIHLWMLFPNCKSTQEDVVARSFLYWEKLLAQEPVDYVIFRETATFLTRPVYFVAKEKGIPCGQLILGAGAGLCVLCDVGELHIWNELEGLVKQGPFVLSDEQKKEVDDFVHKRLPKRDQKMTMRFVPETLLKTAKQYLSLLRHDTRMAFKDDPLWVASLRYGRYRKVRQVLWKYVTQYFFNYDGVDEQDSIVYFPIYSGLETSYLVHTPQWARKEVELITFVARSLPKGVTLYLKEHPHNPGDLSFFELRELSKEPNIKIVRPWASSQYLIEKSLLTVVIQGTAGWEAFLSKKPVLCIEDVAFFGRSDLVYKVTEMQKFESTLAGALMIGDTMYRERQEEWYWFVYSVLSSSGKGDIVNLKPPFGFATSVENVQSVVTYIDKKITKLQAHQPFKI